MTPLEPTETTTDESRRIVIVGASLAGLTLALACATRGVPVRVVERATRRVHGGDNLSVNLASIAVAVGCDPRSAPRLPVVHAYRDRHLTSWPALYGWLRERAGDMPGIVLDEGLALEDIQVRDERARLRFADGSSMSADLVIGADGYRSRVRRAVDPHRPWAMYAGYVVWRGVIDERSLSAPVPWENGQGLWIGFRDGYRLVAAVLPGNDGSLERGQRRITFAWFDTRRDDLLRSSGCVDNEGHVVGTLDADAIPDSLRDTLVGLLPGLWPSVWAEAVRFGVMTPGVMRGAPIAEYKPDRLAMGPLALVGDAAHVLSPMTGSGYATGVDDAVLLSGILQKAAPSESPTKLLRRYESMRLPYVRGLIDHSRRLSAEFMSYAASF